MRDIGEIAEYILDADGSTRDVTFTPVSVRALSTFLRTLLNDYAVLEAYDNDGRDVASLVQGYQFAEIFRRSRGYVHAVLQASGHLIPVLQVFIDWPEGDVYYALELSFFPNDLNTGTFEIHTFMTLIEDWRSLLAAEDYFVRYENASWHCYDSNGLGVIYTGRQLRTTKQ